MLEKEDSINAEPLIITPVYNGPSTDVPLSVCVLQSTVFVHIFHISLWQFIHCYVANFSCCTLHASPFPCCTFLCTFSCCPFCILHFIHIAQFPFCIFFFFFVWHFFVYFYTCHAALLHVAMILFCFLLLLHFQHFAIFSWCTLFMLRLFMLHIAKRVAARTPTDIYDEKL